MASRISEIKGNKNNIEMENLSRENKLVVPLDKVEDDWMRTVGPLHIKAAAEHYGVFDHLYGDAYFVPNVALDVFYTSGADEVPVYRGNTLKPSQAANCPTVNFEAEPGSLWTLVMTTPDCHLESENSEYVHWLVGNIKGGKVSEGETIWDYLQPFPFRGVGYCRYIFVLYKQTGPVDYSALKKTLPCLNLSERTFSTYDFYCERQDLLTPAGLAFYQADWDSSVTSLLRSTLNMTSSPVYSYDFPEPYRPPQKWFPLKQPFNLYMDRYRDEKQIAKEFVVKKLKRTHPFKPPEPPLQFPNCIPFKKGTPSWLKLEMRKERLGWGRINDY
ncbi:hypothetical protein AAG570_004627 [Ranatra chinensis]|uniref:Large ribosomal subunit protein mL38 n=1 Tax=Ranatra chinensis TaxID=642074 RepID=A0ABD0Y1E5_9HEMI